MQINLGHVTASFTLDVYGHTENVLAVRGMDRHAIGSGILAYLVKPEKSNKICGQSFIKSIY